MRAVGNWRRCRTVLCVSTKIAVGHREMDGDRGDGMADGRLKKVGISAFELND